MTEEKEIKCPKCGETKNIKLIKDVECFDEIIYNRKCMNCGHIIESVGIKK